MLFNLRLCLPAVALLGLRSHFGEGGAKAGTVILNFELFTLHLNEIFPPHFHLPELLRNHWRSQKRSANRFFKFFIRLTSSQVVDISLYGRQEKTSFIVLKAELLILSLCKQGVPAEPFYFFFLSQ